MPFLGHSNRDSARRAVSSSIRASDKYRVYAARAGASALGSELSRQETSNDPIRTGITITGSIFGFTAGNRHDPAARRRVTARRKLRSDGYWDHLVIWWGERRGCRAESCDVRRDRISDGDLHEIE